MDEQLSLERNGRKRKFRQHHDEVKLENNEERMAEDDNPRKVCRICKKEFDTGKALGGHMRVHAQELSSQRSINGDGFIYPFVAGEDSGKKNSLSYDPHSSDIPVCNLCGKAFHSWKSLYGHMRCHSGKGIPVQFEDSAHNPVILRKTADSGARKRSRRVVDLLSYIAGWPITGKRGRRSSLPVPEMDIMEAAQNLLWLSTGPHLWNGEDYFYGPDCTAGKRSICYEEIGVRIERESCFILLDDQKKMGQPGSCSLMPKNNGVNGFQAEGNTVQKKKRGRKKKVQVDPIAKDNRPVYPVVIPGPAGGFQCVTCSKKFSTYQALGGHRSKHYRDNNGVGTCTDNSAEQGVQCLTGEVWGLWKTAKMVVDVNQPVG